MTEWESLLDVLDARLRAWRAALDRRGEFPPPFEWPSGLGPCPDRLRHRARRVLAAQRDLEEEMSARRAAVGSLLGGKTGPVAARAPLFIDERS